MTSASWCASPAGVRARSSAANERWWASRSGGAREGALFSPARTFVGTRHRLSVLLHLDEQVRGELTRLLCRRPPAWPTSTHRWADSMSCGTACRDDPDVRDAAWRRRRGCPVAAASVLFVHFVLSSLLPSRLFLASCGTAPLRRLNGPRRPLRRRTGVGAGRRLGSGGRARRPVRGGSSAASRSVRWSRRGCFWVARGDRCCVVEGKGVKWCEREFRSAARQTRESGSESWWQVSSGDTSTRSTPRVSVILPAKFRGQFERGGYLTQNSEGCLALWTPAEFERQMDSMQETDVLGASRAEPGPDLGRELGRGRDRSAGAHAYPVTPARIRRAGCRSARTRGDRPGRAVEPDGLGGAGHAGGELAARKRGDGPTRSESGGTSRKARNLERSTTAGTGTAGTTTTGTKRQEKGHRKEPRHEHRDGRTHWTMCSSSTGALEAHSTHFQAGRSDLHLPLDPPAGGLQMAHTFEHIPVLRDEVVSLFASVPPGVLVDATRRRGRARRGATGGESWPARRRGGPGPRWRSTRRKPGCRPSATGCPSSTPRSRRWKRSFPVRQRGRASGRCRESSSTLGSARCSWTGQTVASPSAGTVPSTCAWTHRQGSPQPTW